MLSRALADIGPSATVSSSARTIYDELSPFGVPPALISASFGDALARIGILDQLTGIRLGWLLVTMTAPLSLFLVVEASRGAREAALSACILVAMPRFLHAAAIASESAVVASLWLLVLALYVRSLPPGIEQRRAGVRRRYRLFAVLFALVFGFALATNVAVLWVLPLIFIHHLVLRRGDAIRAIRRGSAPLPAAFLWLLVLAPGVVLLMTPKLWRGGAVSAAEWLFLRLGPTVDAVTYKGAPVTADTVPAGYAVGFLAATVPVAMTAMAAVGGFTMVRDFVRVRRGERKPDPVGLGALLLLGLGSVLVGTLFEPHVLLKYPPRTDAALPWMAAACAVGIDSLVRVDSEKKNFWRTLAVATLCLAIGLVRVSTASASFSLLVGGTRGAVQTGTWMVGDGSELGVLARTIDALRLPAVSVRAPDVPRNYFSVLSSLGRLSTRVEIGGGAADLVLVRGPRNGALGTADQAGTAIWSLARRH
jgi:hypothetical protein